LIEYPSGNATQPALEPETTPAPGEWRRFLREILETVGMAVVLFLVINLISARVRVEGYSMIPTLQNGEYVLISRLSYKLGVRRRDIIVFRPPMYRMRRRPQRILGSGSIKV
jgi:signal peptidase I